MVVIVLAVLLGCVGVLLGMNGFVVSVSAETVMHQILGAIYLVGGVGIFGLALVATAARLSRPGIPSKPQMQTVHRAKDAEPVKIAVVQKAGPSCVNCGQPVVPSRAVCECGKAY